ncbi:MAG: flagellar export chaperone FliS [Firmicutes bacterium]|nr:flagellar export chaperone FliS [Bacillota bacterium]
MPDAVAQYKAVQIQTAPGTYLILMAYDHALRHLSQAKEAMAEGRTSDCANSLGKVHGILTELSGSLNFECGEMAAKLYRLYEFCGSRLVEATFKRDPGMLDAVRDILTTLREAWLECSKAKGARRIPAPQDGFQVVVG